MQNPHSYGVLFGSSLALVLSNVVFVVASYASTQESAIAQDQVTQSEADDAQTAQAIPEGFQSLFNGQDLEGWKGLVENPIIRGTMSAEELAKAQVEANKATSSHWWVDGGELVSDGHGPHLCTASDYRDFVLLLEWKIQPGGDSGIYLRGCPQVQIWDPFTGSERAKVGSGGLFNNMRHPNDPPVVADQKPGEWNRFEITMLGEVVCVKLNDVLVVDSVVMENYWARESPIFSSGQIELQTHGNETRFRNLFIREIPPEEANASHANAKGNPSESKEWDSLIQGSDLSGWRQGAENAYVLEDGALVCTEIGGLLLTEKTYSDFEMEFEFKLPPGGNNGLALRTPESGDPAFVGLELQILDDSAEKYESLRPWQYHGSVYGVVPSHRGFQRPVGEWNYQRVRFQGAKIEVELNGTRIIDADLSTIKTPMDEREHPGLSRTEGHVGFCGHGDRVMFRNIRIRPLEKAD